LKTYFYTYDGVVKALDGVSFKIRRGETVGMVGETGCGKSVTAFSITRLISDPPGRIVSGTVLYRGANVLRGLEREAKFKPVKGTNRVKVRRSFRRVKAAQERMVAVRGGGIGMIFQEPTSAMNPIFSVSNQLGEALLLHRGDEIIDGLLQANPNAPARRAAFEELVEAVRSTQSVDTVRALAKKVGDVLQCPSMATQAYYTTREAIAAGRDPLQALERSVRRLRLSRIQRSYLRYQRRLIALQQELNTSYMQEMRDGTFDHGQRRAIRRHRLATRYRSGWVNLRGIRRHARRSLDEETFWRSVALLEGIAIANPVQVARSYPHELSGGMIQRVMIAMALSANPDILLADEPTTALDVTIQAQILELMRDLKVRVGTATLFITHDLAVIAEVAERVCVMYAGQVVETANVRDLFRQPLHPYSQGLLASIPRVDQPEKQLSSIKGSVPNLITPPTGCRFHPRCAYAMPVCREQRPPLTAEGDGHTVACFLYKGPVAVE
jgi:peptide/nickel transport system ATP-binding protein